MFRIKTNNLWCSSGVCSWAITILDLYKHLPNISKKIDLYLFAEDTNIYYEDESLVKLEIKVNREFKNLSVA